MVTMEVTNPSSKARHQPRAGDVMRSARSRRSERQAAVERSVQFRSSPAALDPDDFPPLPPVTDLKHAISRQKVCEGISYVLPVDKTKNSVENVFRTNLRVMFKDPYRSRAQQLYQEQLKSLARHHFEPNSAKTEYDWNAKVEYPLNMDSEMARRNFAKSAPSSYGRRSLVSEKPRSVLFSPVTSFVQPAVQKLKEEAEEILKSVGLSSNDKDPVCLSAPGDPDRGVPAAESSVSPYEHDFSSRTAMPTGHAQHLKSAPPLIGGRTKNKALHYDEMLRPNARKLSKMADKPEVIRSPYLSEVKNTDIWLWIQDRKAQPGAKNTDVYS